MLEEFKKFAMRGNVMDMAVGIVIGAAFGRIVTSLVSDVLMPPIGLLLGSVDFTNFFVTLKGAHAATLAEAQKAGAVTINYGVFITAIISFLIVAFAVFLLVKQVNRWQSAPEPEKPAEPTTKQCPYCLSTISLAATRCGFCTSQLGSG